MIDAGSTLEFTLEFTEDPGQFLAAAAGRLAEDPVLTTVVSTVATRALADDEAGRLRPAHPRWWVVVRAGSEVVGLAMRAAPFPPYALFVLPMPAAAAAAIARALHQRGEHVGGVNGVRAAAEALAGESARLQGGQAGVDEHTRLFELATLRPPAPVDGRLRAAGPGDLEVAASWFRAFEADAAVQAGRPAPLAEGLRFEVDDVAARIAEGRVWLWEDGHGEVVHLTGAGLPAYGVTRIGPVYTPPAQRGRGFASAGVAAVAGGLVADGVRVCLFTDQANPTSNRIYQALGFEPVVDMVNLVVG